MSCPYLTAILAITESEKEYSRTFQQLLEAQYLDP